MPLLGLAPVAGRVFTEDEEKPGAPPVAMIGEGLWRRRFGGDAGVIGRTVVLNAAPTTVVGVARAALNLISGGDVYTPLTIDPANEVRLNHVLFVAGRLRPGVTLAQAQAEMDGIAARVGTEYPEVRDWGIHLLPFFDVFVSSDLNAGLLMLALGQTVSSLVYGVTVHDPATYAVVSIVLGAVAMAACAIPALRAAQVDPLVALRHE